MVGQNTDTDLNREKNMSGGKTERQKKVLDLVIEVNANFEDMSLSRTRVGGDCLAEPERRSRPEDNRGAYYEKVKTGRTKKRKETKILIDDEDIITLCDRSTKAVVS